MRSFIIYCPHLNRDIRGLLNAVPYPQIWTGQKTEHGADGCLSCHHEIVKEAQRSNAPFVFVMEDDCHFTNQFHLPTWGWAVEWALKHGYDIVAGGCTRTYDEKVVYHEGKHAFIEVSAFHSAHCVAYLHTGYEKILRTVQPYDLSLGRTGAKCLLTWPFVAIQRPSFSGILQQHVDYVPLYVAHEARLGHALGLLEPHVPMPAY